MLTYPFLITKGSFKIYSIRPLPGDTIDWDCFRPVTIRNRSVTVDFNRWRSISNDISRGRKKKSEKKRENLEIRRCSFDLDPSPTGFPALRKENHRRSWGEENDARHAGFSSRLCGEISTLDARFSGRRNVSPRFPSRSVLAYRVHLGTVWYPILNDTYNSAGELGKSNVRGTSFSLFFSSRFFFLPQSTINRQWSISPIPPDSGRFVYRSASGPVRIAQYGALPLAYVPELQKLTGNQSEKVSRKKSTKVMPNKNVDAEESPSEKEETCGTSMKNETTEDNERQEKKTSETENDRISSKGTAKKHVAVAESSLRKRSKSSRANL
ncbi:hypothetical protein GW17_00030642 [Ensete ventricosum]|nr:hypothetical protein GW17_00030642 [Ensete ventricosum]